MTKRNADIVLLLRGFLYVVSFGVMITFMVIEQHRTVMFIQCNELRRLAYADASISWAQALGQIEYARRDRVINPKIYTSARARAYQVYLPKMTVYLQSKCSF